MQNKNKNFKAPEKLKILTTIVSRQKADLFTGILEGFGINLQMVVYGEGTAPKDITQVLGLKDNSKAIIFSAVEEHKIKDILFAYEDKYFKQKNCKGLAFTFPISSLIGVTIYQFLIDKEDK